MAKNNVKRNPLELTKIELRSLALIDDVAQREALRVKMLAARAADVAQREAAKQGRGQYSGKVSETGYLIVKGNGTFRPLVFTYEGFNTFLANIEAVKALHANMPKVPTPVVKN